MYWVILRWPDSPSLASSPSEGITACIICRMICAVMYGMMPRLNTETRESAPPENRLSTAMAPLLAEAAENASSMRANGTPGAGR